MHPFAIIAASVGISKLLDTPMGKEITHRALSHLNEETKKIFTSATTTEEEKENASPTHLRQLGKGNAPLHKETCSNDDESHEK